jgi:hypothetical protein
LPDPFVSRTDLGDYLNRDLSTDDAALAAVDAASEVCRTIAEQTFNQVDDEDIVLDGTGTDALLLPEFPVIDIMDVTENDEPLVVTDDYKLNSNGILFRMPTVVENGSVQTVRRSWLCGRQNIAVTYSHGYADADLPRDVRMVALSLAARIYQQGPAVFETLGQTSVRYAGPAMDLTNGEKAILRKYRRSR